MYEEANQIFEFLPINKSQTENDYIDHLWNAFVALESADNSARPFVMMPFHLLFMLALQYKVLRIAKNKAEDYIIAFTMESRVTQASNGPHKPNSVYEIAILREKQIIDLLKLIGLDHEKVKSIKELINNRNDNLAHANGGIEANPDGKVDQYLEVLRTLQQYVIPLNHQIAEEWLSEITDEDDLKEFVAGRLLDSYLSPADFKLGALELFVQEVAMPFDDWRAALREVLVIS